MANSQINQFNNPAFLSKIQEKAFEYYKHNQLWEISQLADKLEEGLRANAALANSSPELYSSYLETLLWLRLASFAIYDNDTCLDLIKKHFLDAAKFGLDFNQLMNIKMYSIPDLAWPDFAQDCIRMLKENKQRIGSRPLEIQGEETPKAPAVQNWLMDYNRTFSIDKQSEIQRSQYLGQNPNTRDLVQQEKNYLMNLLKFYDNLKPLPPSMLGETPASSFQHPSAKQELPAAQAFPPYSSYSKIRPINPILPAEPEIPAPKPIFPQRNIYQEPEAPIRKPLSLKQDFFSEPPSPSQTQPRIEGNIIDLKNQLKDQ